MKTDTACKTGPVLTVQWFPANQCWGLTYGDALLGVGPDARRLWPHLSTITAALKKCGLGLRRINAQSYAVTDNNNAEA